MVFLYQSSLRRYYRHRYPDLLYQPRAKSYCQSRLESPYPGVRFARNPGFHPSHHLLTFGTSMGGTKYRWGNWRIILLFVLFGLLIESFIGIQLWKQDQATVPPRIIKQRSVWSAAYFSFALGSFFLLLMYFLPIWFQAVKGASAIKSGIMNLPMILTLVIVSVISSITVTAMGYCKCCMSEDRQRPY
jgi:hypothetical protein